MLAAGEIDPADHVIECSGHVGAVQMAVDLVAPSGNIQLSGMSPTPPSFDAVQVIMKEVLIIAGFIYISEFQQATELLATGAVDVGPLTTGVVPWTSSQMHSTRYGTQRPASRSPSKRAEAEGSTAPAGGGGEEAKISKNLKRDQTAKEG